PADHPGRAPDGDAVRGDAVADEAVGADDAVLADSHTTADDGKRSDVAAVPDPGRLPDLPGLAPGQRPFHRVVRVQLHPRRDAAIAADAQPPAAVEHGERPHPGALADLNVAQH